MNQKHIVLATKKLNRSFFIFSNQTSQQDCLDYKNISLVYVDVDSISLVVPKKSISEGHQISLYVFENNKQLKTLNSMPRDKSILKCEVINGLVIQSDTFDKDLNEIQITVNSKNNEYWEQMITSIEAKQETVSQAFYKYRK
ncbi:hypothetical protein [Bacteriovorax sp. Seq25_V]|uniref:hypothetical protein n=1 Tax=Bacteriovorax sp. Seq25_V TaxID=1201288 RepID=UPI0004010296|nr:hypothetical protein [Bacteriovorax sp. Seq25_V]